MFRLIDPPSRWRSYVWPGVALVLITGLHAAVIAGLYDASPETDRPAEPPSISGLLIAAPAAESVQAPVSAEADPAPEPEPEPIPEPEPEPIPEPKLQPAPIPQPEPEPSPEPAAEPEPQPETESVETALEQTLDIEAEPADTAGAPIVAPSSEAAHLNNPSPAYPRRAIRLGQEGVVTLEVFILADGSVGELRLAESSGYDRLDEAALEAVRRWRFVPATQNGQPIDYWHQQLVTFKL